MGEIVVQRPWLMEAPGLVEPAASTAVSSAAVPSLALIVVHCFQERRRCIG